MRAKQFSAFDKMSIKEFIIKNILFSKSVIQHRPGINITTSSRKWGKSPAGKRIIYLFDEIITSLQEATIKKIGIERSQSLWYSIGKDVGLRYVGDAKISIPDFLKPDVIKHIFSLVNGPGNSPFSESISYDAKKKEFESTGKNSAYCRQTKLGSSYAGLTAGILSAILKKDIDAQALCTDCPSCRIRANKNTLLLQF
jgi:hypothetical protein